MATVLYVRGRRRLAQGPRGGEDGPAETVTVPLCHISLAGHIKAGAL